MTREGRGERERKGKGKGKGKGLGKTKVGSTSVRGMAGGIRAKARQRGKAPFGCGKGEGLRAGRAWLGCGRPCLHYRGKGSVLTPSAVQAEQSNTDRARPTPTEPEPARETRRPTTTRAGAEPKKATSGLFVTPQPGSSQSGWNWLTACALRCTRTVQYRPTAESPVTGLDVAPVASQSSPVQSSSAVDYSVLCVVLPSCHIPNAFGAMLRTFFWRACVVAALHGGLIPPGTLSLKPPAVSVEPFGLVGWIEQCWQSAVRLWQWRQYPIQRPNQRSPVSCSLVGASKGGLTFPPPPSPGPPVSSLILSYPL